MVETQCIASLPDMMISPNGTAERVYAVTLQVPYGQIVSYGQIAREAGCSPRAVGFALAALPPQTTVPWHRVVNRLGGISARHDVTEAWEQQLRLQAEGVSFRSDGQIDMEKHSFWSGT